MGPALLFVAATSEDGGGVQRPVWLECYMYVMYEYMYVHTLFVDECYSLSFCVGNINYILHTTYICIHVCIHTYIYIKYIHVHIKFSTDSIVKVAGAGVGGW